jgi:hypothetical protein
VRQIVAREVGEDTALSVNGQLREAQSNLILALQHHDLRVLLRLCLVVLGVTMHMVATRGCGVFGKLHPLRKGLG